MTGASLLLPPAVAALPGTHPTGWDAGSSLAPAVRLFVGGHAGTICGEREDLEGDRCFSAAYPPQAACYRQPDRVYGLLDSGAFSDRPERRLTSEAALARQLRWEERASTKWGAPWQAGLLASYDWLIDETWTAGVKHKRRWSVQDADQAVRVTIDAAAYLAAQRARLAPRTLVLNVQGVDAMQYEECATDVLKVARPGDWIGLGGWCILGRFTTWLPVFWASMRATLPRIAAAGVRHVHLLGVLYRPALGGLLWLADQYGLTVSSDSGAPILSATWQGPKAARKAGVRAAYWRDNVAWWINALATLRDSAFYREPPTPHMARQGQMWV